MTPNAYVLFDKVEGKYLTTGNSPFYGHDTNPAAAHMYFSDKVAFRQAQILYENFLVNKKYYSHKKDCQLQIVPITVQVGTPEDVIRTPKSKKKGYAVYIEIQTDYMNDPYKGFWKRPFDAHVNSNNEYVATVGNRTLHSDAQKADVWKKEDVAAAWANAVVRGTREQYARGEHVYPDGVKLKLLKVEVRKV